MFTQLFNREGALSYCAIIAAGGSVRAVLRWKMDEKKKPTDLAVVLFIKKSHTPIAVKAMARYATTVRDFELPNFELADMPERPIVHLVFEEAEFDKPYKIFSRNVKGATQVGACHVYDFLEEDAKILTGHDIEDAIMASSAKEALKQWAA